MNRIVAFVVVILALAAVPASASPRTLARNAFPVSMPQEVADAIVEASRKYAVDPNLVAAMAYRESRFSSNAVSRRGAQGVMQLMPRTARSLGVKDAFNTRENILGGAKYLKYLSDRFQGDLDRTLAAYNAGPERVAKEGPRATQEAVEYVAAVKSFYQSALRSL